jgi:hypothetical protein
MRCELDLSGSGYGEVESSCESGSESSGSVKCWALIEWLHSWWPLNYFSAS